MSWVFVPGLEGLNSESELPNPERAASLTWRGKPLRSQVLSHQWKRGGFIRLLSGLTLEPSTLDRGVASFIASLRATPANPTASPESASDHPTTDSSSTSFCALSTSAGLVVSSERTCRGTPTDNSKLSSLHWSEWATALRAEYSARPRSGQVIAASDCSSWPTANARVKGGGEYQDTAKIEARHAAGHQVNLSEAAQLWATPQAHDTALGNPARVGRFGTTAGGRNLTDEASAWPTPRANDPEKRGDFNASDPRNGLPGAAALWMTPNVPNGGRTASHAIAKGKTLQREDGTKVQLGLEHQARTWPSPTVRCTKGGSAAVIRRDGKSRLDMLDYAAEQWSTPRSSDGEKGGPNQSFGAGGIPLATQAVRASALIDYSLPDRPTPSGMKSAETRRRLNPLFVEWLMGWPEGLSGFERSETAFAPWLRHMRGALSTLCSPKIEQQGRLL